MTGGGPGVARSSTRRACLALVVARELRHEDVLSALTDLLIDRGPPAHIRSANGSECIADAVRQWLTQVGVETRYITLGAPWDDGDNESFSGSLRDELLNGEIVYSLAESKVLIEAWRRHYNTVRPYSSLRYRVPAAVTAMPARRPPVSLRSNYDRQWRRRWQRTNAQPGPRGKGCSAFRRV